MTLQPLIVEGLSEGAGVPVFQGSADWVYRGTNMSAMTDQEQAISVNLAVIEFYEEYGRTPNSPRLEGFPQIDVAQYCASNASDRQELLYQIDSWMETARHQMGYDDSHSSVHDYADNAAQYAYLEAQKFYELQDAKVKHVNYLNELKK